MFILKGRFELSNLSFIFVKWKKFDNYIKIS